MKHALFALLFGVFPPPAAHAGSVDVTSEVELACLDTLYDASPGDPHASKLMEWLELCRTTPSMQPGCTLVSGTQDPSCFKYVMNHLHGIPAGPMLGELQAACKRYVLRCD